MRARRSVVVACLVALLWGTTEATTPASGVTDKRSDASGDVAYPEVDIESWVIEVDEGGSTDTTVRVRIHFAGPFPPPDTWFSWFAAMSVFFQTKAAPGQEIHAGVTHSRHNQAPADSTDCISGPCPQGMTRDIRQMPDGTLLLELRLPVPPGDLSSVAVRVRAGAQPEATGTRFDDNWGTLDGNEPPPTSDVSKTNGAVPVPVALDDVAARDDSGDGTSGTTADSSDDGGGSALPIVLVVLVLLAAVLGGVLAFRRRGGGALGAADDCDELIAAWEHARDRCNEARRAAQQAEQDAEEAEAELEQARDERRSFEALEETFIEDDLGNRSSAADVRAREDHLAERWSAYRESTGEAPARDLVQEWADTWSPEQRADRTRAARERLDGRVADAAHRASEARAAAERARREADAACATADGLNDDAVRCIEAAQQRAADEAARRAAAQDAEHLAAKDATDAALRPPPPPPDRPEPRPVPATREREPGCREGDTRERLLERLGPRDMVVDFGVMVTAVGSRHLGEARRMYVRLRDLADTLDTAGTVVDAVAAAKAGWTRSVDDTFVEAVGLATDVPTSYPEAIVETWEFAAKLGARVAYLCEQWMTGQEQYIVTATTFVQSVTMEWRQQWRCRNGRWVCECVLVTTEGPRVARQVRRPEEVTAREVTARADGLTRTLATMVARSLGEIAAFRARHREGPC